MKERKKTATMKAFFSYWKETIQAISSSCYRLCNVKGLYTTTRYLFFSILGTISTNKVKKENEYMYVKSSFVSLDQSIFRNERPKNDEKTFSQLGIFSENEIQA
jgi:hypothetical protein